MSNPAFLGEAIVDLPDQADHSRGGGVSPAQALYRRKLRRPAVGDTYLALSPSGGSSAPVHVIAGYPPPHSDQWVDRVRTSGEVGRLTEPLFPYPPGRRWPPGESGCLISAIGGLVGRLGFAVGKELVRCRRPQSGEDAKEIGAATPSPASLDRANQPVDGREVPGFILGAEVRGHDAGVHIVCR